MNKKILLGIALLVVSAIFAAPRLWQQGSQRVQVRTPYNSEILGISFAIPTGYFVAHEIDEGSGERLIRQIVIMEDTPENRSLVAGEQPGRDGPPTIAIGVYQNNLDHYSVEQFIKGTSYSNFKLSDGVTVETVLAGLAGLRFHATGLYENENIVVTTPRYVYMFTVSFNSNTDKIITDFEDMLKTVTISS